ncbi:MAG TPA: hypothetical protein VKM72_11530 [Thermoanaerobaculia bacterium]|nr:hypothetical protein [Thermoanaerobaculia bacterium]
MSRDPLSQSGSVRIRPCSTCGERPTGTVRVGSGGSLGWLECKNCKRRTSDGQTFEEACREWNRMQSTLPGAPG